jgi:hypothetical protein
VTPSTRYTTNPVVSCGDEKDGAVLFNPDANDTAIVNRTGRALWAFLETPRTVGELANRLVEMYKDVPTEQAMEDAAQFIESLTPDFILEIDDDA